MASSNAEVSPATAGVSLQLLKRDRARSEDDEFGIDIDPVAADPDARCPHENTHYISSATGLSDADKLFHTVPKCCDASILPFCAMCCGCVCLGLVLPLAYFLPTYLDLLTPQFSRGAFLVALIMFTSLGCIYCVLGCRRFCAQGVCCKPKGPPKTSCWVPADGHGAGEAKGEDGFSFVGKVKKLAVIMNPNAGVKKGASNLEICRAAWAEAGVEVEVWETTHQGHAREMGRDKDLTGLDALCVIGGDGSIHELCNGVLARPTDGSAKGRVPPLGFLPGGSGNSIMCDFGTWDMAEAARAVVAGPQNVARMDVNMVKTMGQTVASVNECVFGLVGDIGVIAEDFRWMGPGRYNAVAVWGLLKGFKQHVVVDVVGADGSTMRYDDDFLTVFVNQTQHFGKGMRAAPEARVDDGLLDLTMVKAGAATRGEMLAVLQQMPDGGHLTNPKIQIMQVRAVTFKFDNPGVFNCDGENMKHDGTVAITCQKQLLPVFADKTRIAGSMV